MNADEIMRALKSNAEVNHHAAVMMMAADLIETLQAQLAEQQAANDTLRREVPKLAMESVELEKKLAKLEAEVMVWAKAEQEGRLVVLPCKVGTRVWVIGQNCDLCRDMYAEEPCLFGSCEYKEVFESVFGYGMIDNFGKTVFLTREEAEAALEKQEGAEHE